MPFLYIEPRIYVPYALSLRKKGVVRLTKLQLYGGEALGAEDFKPKRGPNGNYIHLRSLKPKHIDVTDIVDKDAVITFDAEYALRFEDTVVTVCHRQHVSFKSQARGDRFSHYNLNYACPALFGEAGGRVVRDKTMPWGRSHLQAILQYGLNGERPTGHHWAIESLNILLPFEQLLHGTVH